MYIAAGTILVFMKGIYKSCSGLLTQNTICDKISNINIAEKGFICGLSFGGEMKILKLGSKGRCCERGDCICRKPIRFAQLFNISKIT